VNFLFYPLRVLLGLALVPMGVVLGALLFVASRSARPCARCGRDAGECVCGWPRGEL